MQNIWAHGGTIIVPLWRQNHRKYGAAWQGQRNHTPLPLLGWTLLPSGELFRAFLWSTCRLHFSRKGTLILVWNWTQGHFRKKGHLNFGLKLETAHFHIYVTAITCSSSPFSLISTTTSENVWRAAWTDKSYYGLLLDISWRGKLKLILWPWAAAAPPPRLPARPTASSGASEFDHVSIFPTVLQVISKNRTWPSWSSGREGQGEPGDASRPCGMFYISVSQSVHCHTCWSWWLWWWRNLLYIPSRRDKIIFPVPFFLQLSRMISIIHSKDTRW